MDKKIIYQAPDFEVIDVSGCMSTMRDLEN